MHSHTVDRRQLAIKLFAVYDSPFYAAELAEIFTNRLVRRRVAHGQRSRTVRPGAIRQWKHHGILPYYAAPIAIELLEAVNG